MAATKPGIHLKWIEDRREHILRPVHAREMAFDLEWALNEAGTILGHTGHVRSDQGTYILSLGIGKPSAAGASMYGPYRVPNWSIKVVCMPTNESPTIPYGCAGQPEEPPLPGSGSWTLPPTSLVWNPPGYSSEPCCAPKRCATTRA